MRALVTGGKGHLGFNLVALLLSRGHEVRSQARVHSALDGVDVLFHAAAVDSIADSSRDSEPLDTAIAGTEATLRAAGGH